MNIVIMGKSRCGKSTLANLICKNKKGYSKISLDYLVMTFKKVFGELNIKYYSNEETLFTKFVEEYFDNCIYKDNECGICYVLEGANLPIKTILRLKELKNTKVIFLGKTQITTQDFFDEIRKYEKGLPTGGWTKRLSDETLLSWCSDWIEKSKEYKNFCEKNDIEFIDTSINQNDVFQLFLNKLKES